MLEMSWPNRLTIARILLIGPFVIALLNLQEPGWEDFARRAAVAIFFIMAITDGLDGYLARRLRQETLAGKFLDPVADKLLILFSVVLLAYEGTTVPQARLPAAAAVIAVGKDIIVVVGFFIVYLTTSKILIQPNRIGKFTTLAQLAMVIAILISPDLPGWLQSLPRILWWVASVLALLAIVSYFQAARRFIDQHEAMNEPP
jgi:CDP-diacylglycerol--glycerol-3-phosphate 3-phosphatidyltransferase